MPVTILDAWTSTADLVAGAHAHAATAGSNRVGILMFTHEQMGGGGLTISTQVTWGGQNVTELFDVVAGGITGYHDLLWVGYLNETGVAAMSGSTVVVAFDNDDISGPPDGTGPFGNAKAQSAFYQDVDQGSLPTPNAVNTTGTGTATSIVPTDTGSINVIADAKVVFCGVSGQGTTADDINVATGYTNEAEVLGATNDHSCFAFHRTAVTADATHAPSFPCTSANRLCGALITLEFAVAAGETATGAPSITAITTSGAAEVISTATGSPSITVITAAGEAKVDVRANGSPSITAITSAGTAEDIHTSTGSPSIVNITSAGSAINCSEILAPDTIAALTNLAGVVTDIDERVDTPDANWLILA